MKRNEIVEFYLPRVLIKYLFRWKTITKWEITLVKIEYIYVLWRSKMKHLQQYSSHKTAKQATLLICILLRFRWKLCAAVFITRMQHVYIYCGKTRANEQQKRNYGQIEVNRSWLVSYRNTLCELAWLCPLYIVQCTHINNDVWHSFFIISLDRLFVFWPHTI